MVNKSIVRMIMVVILAICIVMQFWHLKVESLLLAIAALAITGTYVWHRQDTMHRLNFAEILDFLSFISLIAIVQTWSFMPGIFTSYTLLFSYVLVGMFLCTLVSLRYRREEIASTLFTWLLLFPLLGLVTYFDHAKMWLVLPFILVPSTAATFPFRDLRVKENFFLPISISYIIGYALAIFIPLLSTIIRHWNTTLLLIILTVTIVGTIMIIWKVREKTLASKAKEEERVEKLKAEEEAERKKTRDAMKGILDARSKQEVYDWYDIYYAYRHDPKGIDTYLIEVPLEGIKRFFKHSELKNQVAFNGTILAFVMYQYRQIFERTMHDPQLENIRLSLTLIVNHVAQWRHVKGYASIIRTMRDNLGADLIVTLKINF